MIDQCFLLIVYLCFQIVFSGVIYVICRDKTLRTIHSYFDDRDTKTHYDSKVKDYDLESNHVYNLMRLPKQRERRKRNFLTYDDFVSESALARWLYETRSNNSSNKNSTKESKKHENKNEDESFGQNISFSAKVDSTKLPSTLSTSISNPSGEVDETLMSAISVPQPSSPPTTNPSSTLPSLAPTKFNHLHSPSNRLSHPPSNTISPSSNVHSEWEESIQSNNPSIIPSVEGNLSSFLIPAGEHTFQTLQIPQFAIHAFFNSSYVDSITILEVTGLHMATVFQNESPEEVLFENLSLVFSTKRHLRRNMKEEGSIFYFDGDFSFRCDDIVDDALVEELTVFSFQDYNLRDYVELLRRSMVEVTDLHTILSNKTAENLTSTFPITHEEASESILFIISISVCVMILLFFSSVLIYQKQIITHCISDLYSWPDSESERPVSVIKCGNHYQHFWQRFLFKIRHVEKIENDDMSAISIDSSLCSTFKARAEGITTIVLESENQDAVLEGNGITHSHQRLQNIVEYAGGN